MRIVVLVLSANRQMPCQHIPKIAMLAYVCVHRCVQAYLYQSVQCHHIHPTGVGEGVIRKSRIQEEESPSLMFEKEEGGKKETRRSAQTH